MTETQSAPMQQDTAYLRTLANQNSPLLPLWFAFYTRLIGNLVPEKLTETGRQALAFLGDTELSPRQSLRLIPHLHSLTATQGGWNIRPLEALQTLLLLQPMELRNLSLLFALVVQRDAVCRTVRRADLLALEAFVGEDGRQFALRRAITFLPDATLRQELARHFAAENMKLMDSLTVTAAQVLDFMLKEMPLEHRSLVALTLHPAWTVPCTELSPALMDVTRQIVRKVLLKEVHPTWNAFL